MRVLKLNFPIFFLVILQKLYLLICFFISISSLICLDSSHITFVIGAYKFNIKPHIGITLPTDITVMLNLALCVKTSSTRHTPLISLYSLLAMKFRWLQSFTAKFWLYILISMVFFIVNVAH